LSIEVNFWSRMLAKMTRGGEIMKGVLLGRFWNERIEVFDVIEVVFVCGYIPLANVKGDVEWQVDAMDCGVVWKLR
jgi:hypothetical protein